MAEKALKGRAISHYAFIAGGESTTKSKGLIAVFRFKYRSRECLEQELIIPRTPSPEPTTPAAQLSVHNMTIAELQRLAQERLDQIHWAEKAKSGYTSAVKREFHEIVDDDEEADKTRAAKRPALAIDLTDD